MAWGDLLGRDIFSVHLRTAGDQGKVRAQAKRNGRKGRKEWMESTHLAQHCPTEIGCGHTGDFKFS